jgi:glycosyltransferase involved in cell wall biosynthesis
LNVPRLSVLLPCRDAELHLDECIASVEAQTLTDYEVLAVDDGSRDGTSGILERWAKRDTRVRLLKGTASGVTEALSLAAGHARTEYLARMDADDVIHAERFDLQRSFLETRTGVAACGTGVRYFPRERVGSGYERYESWLNSLHREDEVERDLFVECPLAHPTMMVRAEAYRRVGGYRDRGWPEDYDLVFRLHRSGYRLANLPEVLLSWRITAGRLSMRSARYSPQAFRRCKVHHLLRGYLPPGRALAIWGAGRVGKPLARELLRHQLQPAAFVDLDPRKIGQEVHGAVVRLPSFLKDRADVRPFVLIAVGSPGAREDIRASLAEMGYEETTDYLALA